ncbi:sigma 54-interacting transcriptional regulator [Amphritea sp. 1_MG-2023]|uniref:sigma-54 interaction domain-containing protein n=1 Tax=Amphritea sp. 1_MG-2023 TaxID=3062670 RepID=UPI0026E213A6|nr:sigma 54-interacting transcriptional regulator [Amphritea sp. 1_MG-2023]MDO6563366.1 sigma 54-interacting transcriptional regulator [Amphritea sp. 1_MG-2023]
MNMLLNRDLNSLNLALDALDEWVVVVDHAANIQFINQPYAHFLGLKREDAYGRYVVDVIENTRMHRVLESGEEELSRLQEIRGRHMIANRYPIRQAGNIVGAIGFVLYHDTHQWQQINTQIKALVSDLDYYRRALNKEQTGAHYHLNDLIGRSPAIQNVNEKIKKVAGGDASVLIRGESGTGKELYAHALHLLSERSKGPFIKINCAAIPEHLLESELFGYAEGAFTGAKRGGKQGKFQLADKGTLFLDEIGDMPLSMQAKLLRVLQDREVEAVGSNRLVKIDVRLVTATHQPLEKRVESNAFREDLYYRINVVSVALPPLRDRREDIPALAEHFLTRLANRTGRRAPKLTVDALTRMLEYAWPGNVREMENAIESAFYLSQGYKISLQALPAALTEGIEITDTRFDQGTLKQRLALAEKEILEQMLVACKGNRQQAAKLLGIGKTTIYDKLVRYQLASESFTN